MNPLAAGGIARRGGPFVNRNACVHNLPDVTPGMLPDFHVASNTKTRAELLDALTAADHALLVIDLDQDDAISTVVNVLEVRPTIGIVGITATTDLNLVIAAQRAGCRQISMRPLDPTDLINASRRAIGQSEDAANQRILAVFGTIGGAGATTFASYLAVCLAADSKQRVGLLDFDCEFGGVARAFDVSPPFTITDMASVGSVDPALFARGAVSLDCGVDIVARPPTIAEAHTLEENAIRSILRTSSSLYPHTVVDLPRRLDPVTGAAVEMCSRLILVAQLTVPSIDNTRRLIEALSSEGVQQDRIEIVINRYRKNVHSITVEMVEKELSHKILGLIPSDYAAVNSALDTGQALSTKNPVRAAIAEIAAKLAGPKASETAAKKGGWFASLGIGR